MKNLKYEFLNLYIDLQREAKESGTRIFMTLGLRGFFNHK